MADSKMALARLPPLSGGKVNSVSPRALRRLEALNGPTYRLNDRLHPLPPPNALKPYVDTKSGAVDTWPAHASGQAVASTSAMLSKNKSLVLVNDEDMGKAQIIPKPRFLEQLENFLKKELRALGVIDVEPSDLRLQAHREVFEYLIEDFKTYKPLLSAIKNEYEMMLAYQRQQIRQLEPLKQMLVTVSEQCEQKIMALREDERGEMSDLKRENRDLYMKISSLMNEQKDLQEQVSRLQTKLEEEYHKYREECDARKLLVADINDLRYQQEDYLASKNAALQNQETEEDPVILKMALQKSREGEKAATQRLNEMVANYGDVIPRRDFEALEKKHQELEERFERSQQDFMVLQAEQQALLDVQKQVTKKRDEFYIELETLKRSSTPRPDWKNVPTLSREGLSDGKNCLTAREPVNSLMFFSMKFSLGGFIDTAGADYFDGQGTGPSVPLYLQHEGPVRNRRLGKRDTTLLVRDIWREKSAQDAERTDGKRQNMAEFLYEYLKRRFSLDQMVTEWGYNLHDACQRYAHDEIIGLFWKILNDQADEEIFHSQLVTIHGLMTQMSKLDADKGNTGMLSRDDFKTCLLHFFPTMDEETAGSIIRAADIELEMKDGMEEIDYKNLFTEDDEGKTGPFLDEVKKFLQTQKEAYIKDVKEALENTNPVSVDDLMRAVSMTDPEIDHDKMQEYLTWSFNTDSEGLKDVNPMDQAAILDRFANGNIMRVGKKM